MINIEKFQNLLGSYIAFKSISTDSQYNQDCSDCANFLKNLFIEAGFKSEIWNFGELHDVVFASICVDKSLPTLLIYGHYDVQPADSADGWTNFPWDLVERNGKFFGRGVADNKGQNLIHVLSAIDALKTGVLKYNLKFLIEGDEETGSSGLSELIINQKEELSCDLIMISDDEILGSNPTMSISFRGTFNLEFTMKTSNSNQHSGIYGGILPNAALEMSKLLAKLFDSTNKVAIEGFYNGVVPFDVNEFTNSGMSENEIMKLTEAQALLMEPNLNPFMQSGMRPTIQVTGTKSGYIGEGFANIVPNFATAKINVRVTPDQDVLEILECVKKFIIENTPDYVELEIKNISAMSGAKLSVTSDYAIKAKNILEETYGMGIKYNYVGGTIPVIKEFQEIFGVDPLMIGLVNADCNMHGIDENFNVELVEKGLKFSYNFLTT